MLWSDISKICTKDIIIIHSRLSPDNNTKLSIGKHFVPFKHARTTNCRVLRFGYEQFPWFWIEHPRKAAPHSMAVLPPFGHVFCVAWRLSDGVLADDPNSSGKEHLKRSSTVVCKAISTTCGRGEVINAKIARKDYMSAVRTVDDTN